MNTATNPALCSLTFTTNATTGYRVARLTFPTTFEARGGFMADLSTPEGRIGIMVDRGILAPVGGCRSIFEGEAGDYLVSFAAAQDLYNRRAAA